MSVIYKETELGEIPIDWDFVEFSSIAELRHGYQFRNYDFTESGVKILKITQIKGNETIDLSSCSFISEERIDDFRRVKIDKGDILIALTGATIGKIARFNSDELVLQNYRVGNFFPLDENNLSKDYLFHYLRSNFFYNQILARQTQSAQQNIGKEEINNMMVFLPKLEEQKAIANILTAFDDKIENLQAQIKTLEQTAQTIFKEWFGKYQVGDELPEGWRIFELNELVDTVNGYSYKGKELVEESSEALVTLKSFDRNGGFQTRGFKPFKGNPKTIQEVHIGDLVVAHTDLTQDAEVLGNPAFIFDDGGYNKMFITMDLVKVNPINKDISSSFLYYLMKDRRFKGHCIGYSNGTTVLHLSKKAIPEYRLPLPEDFDKLMKFTEIANSTTNKISLNKDSIKSLKGTRDTLLPKLMSGQLRVNDLKEKS